MKTNLLGIVGSTVLLLGLVGSARAADHSETGVPGEANCRGQTIAFLAQYAKSQMVSGFEGIGGIARAAGLSVGEVQAVVSEFCAQ